MPIPTDQDPADGSRTVLLAGATGLVGGGCLRRLLAESAFSRIVAVSRRPLPSSERVQVIVTDFDQLAGRPPTAAATALCALGTTMAKAGSKAAFRHVDHDAVLSFAHWARSSGVRTFAIVSSVGAAPTARGFYLRVKGEVERDLDRMGFSRLVILRPGLLLGRRDERRPGEAIAQVAMPLLHPLLRGRLRRYRGIDAAVVARAMIAGSQGPPGQVIWHNPEIEAAAASTATATA
jgi:uncharacterized protein YbjT (DUF2867 family)